MVFLLTVLTAGYFAFVVWVRRASRQARLAADPALPVDDRPPPTAVGWPPAGEGFEAYLDDGFAALDAYLSEGFAA